MQIFFFFFGLVIIGIGVMTSSLEGSSFQVGNGSAADEGLPYRSAAAHVTMVLIIHCALLRGADAGRVSGATLPCVPLM